MEINIDFFQAMAEARISSRHLAKVLNYIQKHQGEPVTYKEASRTLKIEAFEFGRVVRFLLNQGIVKIEIDGQPYRKKISFAEPEHSKNGVVVSEKQDSVMAESPYYYGKNAIEVWQKDDTTMAEKEQQYSKNTITLSGNHHTTMAKMPYHYGENAIELWQNQDNTNPTKERKEKRTKKEKKENTSTSTSNIISQGLEYKEKEREKENLIKEKEKEKERPNLPSWLPIETWNAYVEMRKKIKHPLTDFAIRLYCRAFERLKQGGISEAEIIEAIETSIAKGWQGIFVQGTDILKLKPEPKSLRTQDKEEKRLGGMTAKEYYELWKQTEGIWLKEAKEREREFKTKEQGNLKPAGTLVHSVISQLGDKRPPRDERLKMGWGVKTYASGLG
jgi:hypothetical protein